MRSLRAAFEHPDLPETANAVGEHLREASNRGRIIARRFAFDELLQKRNDLFLF